MQAPLSTLPPITDEATTRDIVLCVAGCATARVIASGAWTGHEACLRLAEATRGTETDLYAFARECDGARVDHGTDGSDVIA